MRRIPAQVGMDFQKRITPMPKKLEASVIQSKWGVANRLLNKQWNFGDDETDSSPDFSKAV
jgi:hypothetical protein